MQETGHLLRRQADTPIRPPSRQLRLPPINDRKSGNPGEVAQVAGNQTPLMFQGRCRDYQIGVLVRMAILTRERPQIGSPIPDVVGHGQDKGMPAENREVRELSRRAVAAIPEEAVLLPSVYYAFNEHHLDFPGTIAVEGDTFIAYISDIGKSLAHALR